MHSDLFLDPALGLGLLTVRLVLGLAMAAHGSQKLFGWFGGYGLTGTAGFFDTMGFRPGLLFAFLASAAEVASGLLVALGLFGPIGPAIMVAVMIVAAIAVHGKGGFFAAKNGIEMPLLYGITAFAIALVGPGLYSLDALFGLASLSNPTFIWTSLLAAAVGGGGSLLLRRPQQVATNH